MKGPYIIGILFFTALSCKTVEKNRHAELLKEYAFCKCVEFSNGGDSIFKNDVSRSVYMDISHYDLNTHRLVDSIAKIYAQKIRPSEINDHGGKKAIFLRCFEFFHSKALDSTIKKSATISN